jgi:hypothetical protein
MDMKHVLIVVIFALHIRHCLCPTAVLTIRVPKRKLCQTDHDYVKWNEGPPRVPVPGEVRSRGASRTTCRRTPHPNAQQPLKRGSTMSQREQIFATNVYWYMTKQCTNPRAATAAALSMHTQTVSQITSAQVRRLVLLYLCAAVN